jgi:hypothetical protein
MVNARFPDRTRYGFEMVDARKAFGALAESRHQSKIYAESNNRIFHKFSAI